jgi:hypothetical protein
MGFHVDINYSELMGFEFYGDFWEVSSICLRGLGLVWGLL